jgi:hypothetical protein
MERLERVWVFCGSNGHLPSGVFTERVAAERWIESHSLSGLLTAYPLDSGVYEWAIDRGVFRPTRPHHTAPDFIQRFTSASLEHFHYEDGEPGGEVSDTNPLDLR